MSTRALRNTAEGLQLVGLPGPSSEGPWHPPMGVPKSVRNDPVYMNYWVAACRKLFIYAYLWLTPSSLFDIFIFGIFGAGT